MTLEELAAYEAARNFAIAAQNSAWIAKWGLPPVDPATAARAAAKEKEWADWLATEATREQPEEVVWEEEMEWEGALAEWTAVWRSFSKEKPE